MHKSQKWKNRREKFKLIKIQQCSYVIAIMSFITLIYIACNVQLLPFLLALEVNLKNPKQAQFA